MRKKNKSELISAKIKYGMELYGVDSRTLALAARMSERTFRDRMQCPDTFKVRELVAISAKIHVPIDKLLSDDVAI